MVGSRTQKNKHREDDDDDGNDYILKFQREFLYVEEEEKRCVEERIREKGKKSFCGGNSVSSECRIWQQCDFHPQGTFSCFQMTKPVTTTPSSAASPL